MWLQVAGGSEAASQRENDRRRSALPRTATQADLFLQIRAGTDIAFLGGLVNYAIQNNRIAKDYLINYTNAAFIVKEGFKLPEDGLFSGLTATLTKRKPGITKRAATLDRNTTDDRGNVVSIIDSGHRPRACKEFRTQERTVSSQPSTPQRAATRWARDTRLPVDQAHPDRAERSRRRCFQQMSLTIFLQHPRSVFQLLKQQYSRYTPEMVERITVFRKTSFSKPRICSRPFAKTAT